MAIPISEDLVILQGASFFKDVVWEEGDEMVPSTLEPQDLTDFDAYMQIRVRYDDANPICSVDSKTDGQIIVIPDDGVVRIRIPPEMTAKLPWKKRLIYDIKLVNRTTHDAYRLREGFVRVKPEVTKLASA